MRTVLLSVLSLCLCASVVSSLRAQPGWQELRPKGAGFSVAMPGVPRIQRANPAGTAPVTTYAVGTPLGTFAIGHSDPDPKQAPKGDMKKTFDQLRDSFVKSTKGTVKQEKNETIEGYPGREIQLETEKKMWMRIRFYVVEKKFYQLIITGSREGVLSKEADHFFDSFKLVDTGKK